MTRTSSLSVFWNIFIYQIVPEIFKPLWQIMRRVSSYFFVVIILGGGISVSAGPSLILSLLVDAGCSVGVTVSCDEDVGDVGEDGLDGLVDRPETTNGT